MSESLRTISPVDGSVYVERPLAGAAEINKALDVARAAQAEWRNVPVATRQEILRKAVAAFVAKKDEIAAEISWQMGRPISQAGGEVNGFKERADYMIDIAPEALGDYNPGEKAGFNRFIRREPLGVVAIIAPWNFPYLTAVNGVVPALMAGNAVVLKHSHQTPLCAERFAEAFEAAGLPKGLFQYLHLSHADAEKLMGDIRIDFVNFTGSVPGGHAVQKAVGGKFIATGMELGGKDPAYLRSDVNINHAVENVIDGAFFNSGQSCCGIERIYAHESVFDAFVEKAAGLVSQYRLGSPIDTETNLGPMVRASSAAFVRGQIADAIRDGAKALIDPSKFAANKEGTPYLAPQVLINVDHSMRVMSEESFGPVVGIMKVTSDDEAIALMNDSEFGLTASIWTADEDAALSIGDRLQTGTVFMNRADYLDPALAWTGVKNSGRGCTLSKLGYESLTRPKSFHLRTKI
ncbi:MULTISPECIES: aldehyde dehydrogenase family protein [Thalassospira]|uniref:aldehyde dehydrogenase family protein n=1 Tax=Thalassospira TaxID=168934 RepID=UPI0008DDA83D|nr:MULTISPECIES: aldehyde dehydrogenase family protein [Thalassospira]MAB34169.1 aldehyde dehydrogenase [Thalassospira sp.]MDM7975265.1 aldehyde dehydrogenase family protein [Thalassospira xiamenensis]OHZ00954.1 aldehyde dehydrogenase [Thalassospira sp. MIT1004]HBS24747.1 aldehyde dehydrogenase [Thalassospira sp.]